MKEGIKGVRLEAAGLVAGVDEEAFVASTAELLSAAVVTVDSSNGGSTTVDSVIS